MRGLGANITLLQQPEAEGAAKSVPGGVDVGVGADIARIKGYDATEQTQA